LSKETGMIIETPVEFGLCTHFKRDHTAWNCQNDYILNCVGDIF